MTAAVPLLALSRLSVRFGAFEAVSSLNLTVGHSETVALVGESGCGKSSVALAILRLLPRRGCSVSGGIVFEGEDIAAWPERRLRALRGAGIAMVFQDAMSALNPVWTIGDQIAEAVRLHEPVSRAQARRRAIELLDLVAVPEPHRRVDSYPHELSGGLRQRAMIAMAVACRPRLLIADEPTTALDVTTQAQVLALLDRLRRDLSMSVLFITHDLGIVADHADRTIVMYAGRGCEEGDTAPLLDRPLHPYTRSLIAALPERTPIGERLAEIPGNVRSAAGATGCRFEPRCGFAEAACRSVLPEPVAVGSGRHLVACPIALAGSIDHAAARA